MHNKYTDFYNPPEIACDVTTDKNSLSLTFVSTLPEVHERAAQSSPKVAFVPAGLSASCVPLSWRHCWWGCDRSGLCWRLGVQHQPVATSYCHHRRSSQWPEPGKYWTHWNSKDTESFQLNVRLRLNKQHKTFSMGYLTSFNVKCSCKGRYFALRP